MEALHKKRRQYWKVGLYCPSRVSLLSIMLAIATELKLPPQQPQSVSSSGLLGQWVGGRQTVASNTQGFLILFHLMFQEPLLETLSLSSSSF